METRLNLLCEAGVIDKDICKGMMQVVNVLETECNFAFFSGLIDAQFWAGNAQPKSPELTANCC
ncbi:TPA: hypothetical protein JLC89_001720 [Escherichia coli]|nr:hypothetical protein [Escherichia coli]